jgi:hypothetical protein
LILERLKEDPATQVAQILARLEPANSHNPWRAAARIAFVSSWDDFVRYFSQSHLPKSQILWLAEVIPALPTTGDNEPIFSMCLAFLRTGVKSEARLRAILIAITVTIHHFQTLPSTFCESFFSLLSNYVDILPPLHVALCLREISGHFNLALARLSFLCQLAHVPPLSEGLIVSADEISSRLAVWRVSALSSILRRLIAMTQKPVYAREVLGQLSEVITECARYSHGFGVGELLGSLVRQLCTADAAFVSSRSVMEDVYFSDIMVKTGHPSFVDIAETLPCVLQAVDKSSRFYAKLMQFSMALGAPWTSMPVFLVYLKCLAVKVEAISGERERSHALAKAVTAFFDKNVDLDCYEYEKCLDAWLQLMRKYLTFQRSSELIVSLFLGRVPRFFPAFVQLAKIAKTIANSPSATARASLPKFIEAAEAGVQVDAYKRAVRLLLDTESVPEAVNLTIGETDESHDQS